MLAQLCGIGGEIIGGAARYPRQGVDGADLQLRLGIARFGQLGNDLEHLAQRGDAAVLDSGFFDVYLRLAGAKTLRMGWPPEVGTNQATMNGPRRFCQRGSTPCRSRIRALNIESGAVSGGHCWPYEPEAQRLLVMGGAAIDGPRFISRASWLRARAA